MASTSKSTSSDVTSNGTNDLSPEAALQLYESGAFLLFLDFPEGSEFGIDYMSWRVGPKFNGLKMIPPGIHFVYYSARCSGDYSPRIGFFVNMKPNELVVKKWDKQTEDVSTDPISGEEITRYRTSLRSMDAHLAAYPLNTYRKWYSLTNYITTDLIEQLHPLNGRISTQCELITKEQSEGGPDVNRVDRAHPVRLRYSDDRGLPIMTVKTGCEIRFHSVSAVSRVPAGCTGSDITKHSMDASNQLDRYLSTAAYTAYQMGILGEMQFAFVCFLMGQVYAGFEQWKQMVHMLCSCDHALVARPQLYDNFLGMLHFQLQECPKDFFVDIISRDNFLTATLGNLFENFDANDNVKPVLRAKAKKFKAYLEKRFRWSFDDIV